MPSTRFRKGDAITAECFSQLTEPQLHVLGCCAIQQDGAHSQRTLDKLVEFGMLEAVKERHGMCVVTRYVVPLYVHVVVRVVRQERHRGGDGDGTQ